MLTAQAAALARIEQMAAAERWRPDRRQAWTAILRALACGMDWETGLVAGITAAQLAAVGGRSARTVSAVLAWARDVGLLVVVEPGASAAFLGSTTNRAPSYAFLAGPGAAVARRDDVPPETSRDTDAAEQLCDLPVSYVGDKPLPGGRRLERPTRTPTGAGWPVRGIPETPSQRSAAVAVLVRRLGLDGPGVPTWRLRAGLSRWFEAGWCPAGLLWAMDHHPDRPEVHRGDALRGAGDPIRVLLARLAPWSGRLGELPAALVGIPGDYRARQAAAIAAAIEEAEAARAARAQLTAAGLGAEVAVAGDRRAAHRAHLRAEFAAHRRAQADRRAGRPLGRPPQR